LEEANIKLDSVITDVMGLSGRRMIEAIIGGETDPIRLAALAHRRIKAPREMVVEALRGRGTDYHRFMLQLYVDQHDALAAAVAKIDRAVDAAIARMDEKVEADQATFLSLIILLCSIPRRQHLVGDGDPLGNRPRPRPSPGQAMSRFPTSGHLLAWAGMCPAQNESATGQARGLKAHGKRRSSRLRKSLPSRRRGRSVAHDNSGSMRLGGQPQKGQLLQGAVQPVAQQTRPEESHMRRRRLDVDRDLPHAQGRHLPPRSG